MDNLTGAAGYPDNPTRRETLSSLDAPRADCVGTRLERDLSLGQLRQLGRAAAAYRRDDPNPGVLTVGDLVRVAGQLKEPATAARLVSILLIVAGIAGLRLTSGA